MPCWKYGYVLKRVSAFCVTELRRRNSASPMGLLMDCTHRHTLMDLGCQGPDLVCLCADDLPPEPSGQINCRQVAPWREGISWVQQLLSRDEVNRMVLLDHDGKCRLQWHNGCDGVSNHQPHVGLLNRLFRRRSKHQSSASLVFVWGIHWWPVNSPHKGPATRKMFQFDDVIRRENSQVLQWRHIIVNTLRPRQHQRYFTDDIFKCIFVNENVWISLKIPLKFVPKGPINNPTLVQIMAWCLRGDKPLSEPMMVSLATHIYVTLPQWVKAS